MENFSADLWQMVEDELLLVVPPYPVHERADCPATDILEAYKPSDDDQEGVTGPTRENPFDVLAGLKKDNKH